MRSANVFLIAFVFFTGAAPSNAHAANTCQAVFRSAGPIVDLSYGRGSQRDPHLFAANLIGEKGSQLCGPTCVFNALEKFKRTRTDLTLDVPTSDGINPTAKANGEKIADVTRRYFPKSSIVERGARIETVADAFRKAMRDEGLRGRVTAYSAVESEAHVKRGLNPWHFIHTLNPKTAVIAKFGTRRQRDLNFVSEANRIAGHYMIPAGTDPDWPNHYYFIDPMAPRQLRVARLRGVYLPAYRDQVIVVEFLDAAYADRTVLIDGLVVAQLE